MAKSKPIHIRIEHPCSENWDAMQSRDNGRFCSSCKKTVIDFSGLSDTDLYRFFQTHNDGICGRFRTHQLNRDILPVYPKKLVLRKFYNTAAILLALLTMKNSGATIIKKENIITIQPASAKEQAIPIPEKIIISGNVKDPKLKNIENAEIKFGDSVVAKTDANGNFEFEITGKEIKPALLFFSYDNLITTVRSYHPAMLSTRYEIILATPENNVCQEHMMGAPLPNIYNFEPFALNFSNSTTINDEGKALLSSFANSLRNNPHGKVSIIAYPAKNTSKSISQKRLNAVRKFLVEEEGIIEERFTYMIEKYSTKKQNTVEFKPLDKDIY